MSFVEFSDVTLHYQDQGSGAPVVFSNALGTDLTLWGSVIDHLDERLRIIRYDTRGHGKSSCPPAPYSMGKLVHDAERLLDHLGVKECVFIGLSMGGMVAQGLAAKRLDLVRAMVLSNTAAKISTRQIWNDRIATVKHAGTEGIADQVIHRWFSKSYRDTGQINHWRQMLCNQPNEGYIGCAHAIAGTDFYTPTASLTLPTLAIAGPEDRSTPPDLVRETAELIKGSRVKIIHGTGHIPCVEHPKQYAEILMDFFKGIGHV